MRKKQEIESITKNINYRSFLIFNVGSKGRTSEDVTETVKKIKNGLDNDHSLSGIVIVNDEASNIDIKCINPILLTEREYEEIQQQIDVINERFNNQATNE